MIQPIDIIINGITLCLVERATGNELDTIVIPIKSFQGMGFKKSGWFFDWVKVVKDCDVFALKIEGSDVIEGLIALRVEYDSTSVFINYAESAKHNIGNNGKYQGVGGHLFAIASKISFENQFGGYVYFDTKTELIDHYKKLLMAKQIGSSQRMMLDPKASEYLVNRYFD